MGNGLFLGFTESRDATGAKEPAGVKGAGEEALY